MQASQKNQLTFAKEVLLNIQLLQHASLKQANHRKSVQKPRKRRTFHALCELFNSPTAQEQKGLFCHRSKGNILTVNAQEQREVGVLALSPLGDNAVDRLEILQAAGQLPVQLLGQAGCVSRQGLGCHLRLPEPLLQRQVLLDQLLVLHGQLDTRTRHVRGSTATLTALLCDVTPTWGWDQKGSAPWNCSVPAEKLPGACAPQQCPQGWALPGPAAKAVLGLQFCCPQLESSASSIPSPSSSGGTTCFSYFPAGHSSSHSPDRTTDSRKQERLSCGLNLGPC